MVVLVVLVDVGQSQCPISLRGAVNSLSLRFGLLHPYLFFDLGSPSMVVVEDNCNGSVGS